MDPPSIEKDPLHLTATRTRSRWNVALRNHIVVRIAIESVTKTRSTAGIMLTATISTVILRLARVMTIRMTYGIDARVIVTREKTLQEDGRSVEG
jgi:hypothetical protein